MLHVLTSDRPAVTSTLRDLVAFGRVGKNRPVQAWAEVTDVESAASHVVLHSVDFHAFVEGPIVLGEQATGRFLEVVTASRVELNDEPAPFNAA